MEKRTQIEVDENFLKTGIYSKSCGMEKNPPCPSKEVLEKYKIEKGDDSDLPVEAI
jgi:hypothetical protein